MPFPETFYTSPMDRCLATVGITFGGLELRPGQEFVPKVKEVSSHSRDDLRTEEPSRAKDVIASKGD